MQELIAKWEEFVREHNAYLTAYESSSKAVDELQRRLEDCADTAGDKQIIEDKLVRVQVGHVC